MQVIQTTKSWVMAIPSANSTCNSLIQANDPNSVNKICKYNRIYQSNTKSIQSIDKSIKSLYYQWVAYTLKILLYIG